MEKTRFAVHRRKILASQICTMLAAAPFAVNAQTPPSAGTLFDANRQQLSPAENVNPPAATQPPTRIEKETEATEEGASLPAGGPGVKVSGFVLSGNQSLQAPVLQAELQEFVGRELDFAGLGKAAAKLTAYYRAQGYLVARAYLPAQEIRDGMVTIGIREGIIGQVIAEPDSNVRLSRDLIDRHLARLHPGDVIQESDLENTLLRISDIAGVSIKAVLRPSAQVGATDIIVKISEMTAITSRVSIDNGGSYYTGSNRLSVSLSLNDALGMGESLSLNTQQSFEGLRIAGLSYVQPIGATGLSVGASFAGLQYNIGKNLKEVQANGEARISTLFLNAALLRSRRANVNLSLAAEYRHFQDTTAGTTVDKSANVISAGLYGDWRDGWLGAQAINSWNVRWGLGHLNKETLNDAALDRFTANAAGDYKKLNLAFSRLQQLGGGYSLLGSVNAQYADKNLDASEKMSLGGSNGVRAYPSGEAAGDQGILARVELRKTLGTFGNSIVEGALFADAGRVTVNKKPWDSSENRASRYGYGVGLNVYNKDLVFNATFAFSPGVNPTSEPKSARRLWLSVSGSPQAFTGLASSSGSRGEDFEEAEDGTLFYGSLGIIPEYVSRTASTPASPADQSKLATPNGRNMSGFWRARDNVSYIGARGGIPIYEQWKLLWQLELGLSLSAGAAGVDSTPDWTHRQDLRNTGVAVAHPKAGTAMYGNWDMPLKESANSFDPFGATTSAAHYNIIGSPGFATSITRNSGPVGTAAVNNNDDAAFNRRQAGMFGYWTPKFGGFQLKLAYSNNGMKAAPDVDTGYLYGGSLSYERGGFSAVVAAEQHINYFGIASLGRNARGVGTNTHVTQGTSSNDYSVRFGVAYDFGATKVSFIADELSYAESGVINTSVTSTDMSDYRRRAYLVGISHKIGAWQLRASHARAFAGDCTMISGNGVTCSTAGMGATSQAVGFSYAWSKQLRLFGQYVLLRNQPLANYNYAVAGVFGSAGAGTTIRALGVGINYTF
ncbi:Hemolysin activation/secretion protein [Polaromonas sp. YR568]|uniref:porin n=1 Tax=Polaromonas sp. YR568 TaxID=1855301 RepID=UPI0008EB7950|nr:porin [Polaromonas sp. YR568]SFU80553.1 Hemolysin activation/secretion protein [Polaromonas sp. YR568]